MCRRTFAALGLCSVLGFCFLTAGGAGAQGKEKKPPDKPNQYVTYFWGSSSNSSLSILLGPVGSEIGADLRMLHQSRAMGRKLAERIQQPLNNDPKVVKAAQTVSERCDGGDQKACVVLGVFAAIGYGVPRNQQRADLLFRKACTAGEPEGCGFLAIGYERDYPKESINLYGKACFASQGESYSCERLATLHEQGKVVPLDKPMAAALYKRRCEKANKENDPAACEGWTRLSQQPIQPADIASRFPAPTSASPSPRP